MTANLDFSNEVFIYTQTLSNNGDAEYWQVNKGEKKSHKLTNLDTRLFDIRNSIDMLEASGRTWLIASNAFDCRVTWHGLCTVTLRPLTLDVNGRVSPVVLLFNALKPSRHLGLHALKLIQNSMKRRLSAQEKSAMLRLCSLITWPRFFILLHIIFFSRRISRD